MGLGTHAVVLITTSSREEGEKIAETLVASRLAACVNIVDNVFSIYEWKGKIEKSGEALLVIKTRLDKVEALIEQVRKLHSYEVPEVIALPIVYGYVKYLEWLDNVVTK